MMKAGGRSVLMRWCCAGGAALLLAHTAWAGAQAEEPLADAVRTALSAAAAQSAPPMLVFADQTQKYDFDSWADAAGLRLKKRKPEEQVRREFLQTVWYEAKRAGLDPSMVLGLIQVESVFRKYAI